MSNNTTPLESLSFTATFQKVFKIFTARFDVFLSLAAAVIIPFVVVSFAVAAGFYASVLASIWGRMMDPSHIIDTDPSGIDFLKNHEDTVIAFVVTELVLYLVLTVSGRGAMIQAAAEIYVGGDPQWYPCLKRGFWHFWALLCSGLLIALGVFVSFLVPILLIVHKWWGLGVFLICMLLFFMPYMYLRLALTYPAIVVENQSACGGINRSLALSKNSLWQLFLPLLTFFIVRALIVELLETVLDPIFEVIFALLLAFVFHPCSAILNTVLYFNCRIEKEGMTQDALCLAVRAWRHQEPLLSLPLIIPEMDAHGFPATGTQVVPAAATETQEVPAVAIVPIPAPMEPSTKRGELPVWIHTP